MRAWRAASSSSMSFRMTGSPSVSRTARNVRPRTLASSGATTLNPPTASGRAPPRLAVAGSAVRFSALVCPPPLPSPDTLSIRALPRALDGVLTELPDEGPPRHPQQLRGLGLVPARALERLHDPPLLEGRERVLEPLLGAGRRLGERGRGPGVLRRGLGFGLGVHELEVLGPDRSLVADEDRVLDGISQLADVPLPGVLRELSEGLRRDLGHGAPELGGETGREVPRERLDLGCAFAEGRDVDRD